MNILTGFLRRLSGNHIAQDHFKNAVKALMNEAVDRDDETGLEQALALYQELRNNNRVLPGSPQPSAEVHFEVDPAGFTDEQMLRRVVASVMLTSHSQGFTSITSLDLFEKVNIEMARQGGWKPRDLDSVPFRNQGSSPRPYWRENLSRVLSVMKADGDLANPTAMNTRTYCLGPQLLRQLPPANEEAMLPPSIDVTTLHTIPLPEGEGLPGWQAIS
jgi:hypothetical protein